MAPDESRFILLVEDEPDLAEIFSLIVQAEGYRVTRASDGAEALHILEQEPDRAALILLDLMMPRMDGVEFCRRKAANPELADVPVVVISAVADATVLPAASGVRETFSKPITIEQLLQCVGTWGGSARIAS